MTIHGQINGEDYTVPDGYRVIPEAYADRLIGLANILSDLDRNFEGRRVQAADGAMSHPVRNVVGDVTDVDKGQV